MADGTKLKDLETKLFVLAQGLREEKTKAKDYLDKINELEETITKKDNEITLLSQSIQDLQTNISFDNNKHNDTNQMKLNSEVNKHFPNDKINFTEFDKMRDINAALRYENKIISKQCLENTEELDHKKMKFAAELAEKDKEISKENECKQYYLNKQQELKDKKHKGETLINDFDIIEDNYRKTINELEINIKQNNDEIHMFMTSNQMRNQKELEPRNKKILSMNEQIKQLSTIYNELKNKSTQSTLEPEIFEKIDKIEGLMKRKKVSVTFCQNEKTKKYEMILTSEVDKSQEIYDMSWTKGLNTKDKQLIYTYSNGSEDISLKLEMDPLIVDYFGNVIETYANQALDEI